MSPLLSSVPPLELGHSTGLQGVCLDWDTSLPRSFPLFHKILDALWVWQTSHSALEWLVMRMTEWLVMRRLKDQWKPSINFNSANHAHLASSDTQIRWLRTRRSLGVEPFGSEWKTKTAKLGTSHFNFFLSLQGKLDFSNHTSIKKSHLVPCKWTPSSVALHKVLSSGLFYSLNIDVFWHHL